jgi:hypothetical protein
MILLNCDAAETKALMGCGRPERCFRFQVEAETVKLERVEADQVIRTEICSSLLRGKIDGLEPTGWEMLVERR